MVIDRRALIAGLVASTLPFRTLAATPPGLIELRRCKLPEGAAYDDIDRLTRQLGEAFAELGAQLLGGFYCEFVYSLDGPLDEFVWLLGYPNLAPRSRALDALATEPRWKLLRNSVDALMRDEANGLLLRPRRGGWSVPEQPSRRLYTAMIHDLHGVDQAEFADYFQSTLVPRLERGGIRPFATCLSEAAPADVPGFALRADRVFVWFAQWRDPADETMLSLTWRDSEWRDGAPRSLLPALERKPEHLLLFPLESSPTG